MNPDKQVLPESGHFEFTYVRTPELICLSLDTLSLPTIQVLTCALSLPEPRHTLSRRQDHVLLDERPPTDVSPGVTVVILYGDLPPPLPGVRHLSPHNPAL